MKTITPQIRRARAEIGPIGPIRPIAAIGARSIAVEIEQVVFHGFSRGESQRASAALQRELTRLVTVEPDVLIGLGSANTLDPRGPTGASGSTLIDAGMVRASAARPELTGIRAARAIHGKLRA